MKCLHNTGCPKVAFLIGLSMQHKYKYCFPFVLLLLQLVCANVEPFVKLLTGDAFDFNQDLLWAVHPGGKAIVDACEKGLNLTPGKLQVSRFDSNPSSPVQWAISEMHYLPTTGPCNDFISNEPQRNFSDHKSISMRECNNVPCQTQLQACLVRRLSDTDAMELCKTFIQMLSQGHSGSLLQHGFVHSALRPQQGSPRQRTDWKWK